VTVRFGNHDISLSLFDPTVGFAAIEGNENVISLDLVFSDRPIVIEISRGSGIS
jgi:hypothetical protein